MDTRAAAEKWGCTDRDVRDWCRGGHIAGSTKEKRKWLIPDDAQRPLDRKLQREILWQVLRRKDNRRRWIDLTRWGVSDDKIADYIALLLSTCLRRTPDAEEIGSIDDIELTEKGFSLLGYGKESEAEDLPKVIRWSASAAGTFAASFTFELSRLLTGLS